MNWPEPVAVGANVPDEAFVIPGPAQVPPVVTAKMFCGASVVQNPNGPRIRGLLLVFTVTVSVSESTHMLLSVTITVYSVVVDGYAIGAAIVESFSVMPLFQTYMLPPPAEMAAVSRSQIVVDPLVVTVGSA